MIRAARFADIPEMCDLLREAHARSRYRDIPANEKLAKSMLAQAIQRNGGKMAGGCFVAVAETDDGLDGMILATLRPLYNVLNCLEANDIFWISRVGAHPKTAGKLLSAMHKWADSAGAVVRQATTDLIIDPDTSGRLLERCGMKRAGNIYELAR